MPQYLVSTYLPDNFDPSTVDEKMVAGFHEFNRELDAAGVSKFACGLGAAHTVRTQPDGELLLTDGPYLETKEHVGGLSIWECANVDEVLKWVRKGARLCGVVMPTEVREIFFVPAPEKE